MSILAYNLPGRTCPVVLTDGTGRYWNKTQGAWETRNTAHVTNYTWATTAGVTQDSRGYVAYSLSETFAGVPDGAVTVTFIDQAGGSPNLDADEALAFGVVTGAIVSEAFVQGSGGFSPPSAPGRTMLRGYTETFDGKVVGGQVVKVRRASTIAGAACYVSGSATSDADTGLFEVDVDEGGSFDVQFGFGRPVRVVAAGDETWVNGTLSNAGDAATA